MAVIDVALQQIVATENNYPVYNLSQDWQADEKVIALLHRAIRMLGGKYDQPA